ncbi:MAG: protein kinase [Deltaproteobacteria bacterium]|nr:protein kinase [Deltaproteobacteria bacterium]
MSDAMVERIRTSSDPLIGAVLGERYRIDELVGEGGMGKVYLGMHTMMRKRIAVKVIHPELTHVAEVVARFEREAVAAAHIEHPNAVAATDFGKTAEGSLFLVMEYVEGFGLDRSLEASARLPAARAVHIARQVLRALRRAHALGIVHRDIKPQNITLVERDGDPDFVKVLDFGIAKMTLPEAAAPLTQVGMVYGTPEYMSPEQATGSAVDARADLYSVGVVLYEMLCGRRPFESDSPVGLLGMHVTARPPPPSEVASGAQIPTALEALVLRLLAKLPEQRCQSAGEALDALDAIDLHVPVGALARTHWASRSAAARAPTIGQAMRLLGAATRDLLARTTAGAVTAASGGPRRAWVAVGLAAATLAIGTLLTVSVGGGEDPLPPSPPGLADPLPVAPPSEPTERPPMQAPARESTEARMQHTLGSTLADAGELGSAVAHYRAALELDARYADDEKLRADLVRALGDHRSADAARAVLRERVGERAAGELATAAAGRRPLLRKNARELLEALVPADRLPPWIREVDALRAATTCAARRQVVQRMRALADPRVLPSLTALREDRRGCGFLGLSDCNACLRPELAATIQALQGAAAPR